MRRDSRPIFADLNDESSFAETVRSVIRCECSEGEPIKSVKSCRSDNVDDANVSSMLLVVVAFIEFDGWGDEEEEEEVIEEGVLAIFIMLVSRVMGISVVDDVVVLIDVRAAS